MKKGYYSLLQYFPSFDRDERMNIAVILESPTYNYVGAKYLRHMDGRLRCFDPSVDSQVIRLVANQIESSMKSREEMGPPKNMDPFFEEVRESLAKPVRINELRCFFEESRRTLWHITEPKTLLLPHSQRFDERLEYLYSKLIAPPNLSNAKVFDKQYVRSRTETAMAERHILIGEAGPVKGEDFADNDFDGLSVRDREILTETYWQFASFDVSNVRESFDQVRLFMEKVEDVRAVKPKIETAMRERHFTVVLQPPKQKKSEQHKTKFDVALAKLDGRGIRAFEVDNSKHYNNLAEALREGINPWEVRGLNN